MKKIAGVIISLFVLLAGSYYGTGVITESKVRETLNVVNKNNGIYTQVKDYQRGFFHSSANIEWKFNMPQRIVRGKTVPSREYKIIMPLKVEHGPVIFSNSGVRFGIGQAQTQIDLPAKYVSQFNDLFTKESIKPQFDLGLFINYFGKTSVTFAVPEFKLTAKKGSGTLTWKGLDSSIHMNSSLSSIDGELIMKGMNFTQDDKMVTMQAVTSEYALSKSDYGLYIGSASLEFPSLVVMNNSAKVFELDKLDVSSSSDISGDVINSYVNFALNSIVVNNETFGPGRFEMSIKNLDAEAMGDINKMANKLNGDSSAQQQVVMQMMSALPKLLSHGAEFQISTLEFKLPNGKIEGNLYLQLPKNSNASMFNIMKQLTGKAYFSVPRELVRMAIVDTQRKAIMSSSSLQQSFRQQQNQKPMTVDELKQKASSMADNRLEAMIKSGVFEEQGNNLTINLSLMNGQFMVNGKPFNPAMVQF